MVLFAGSSVFAIWLIDVYLMPPEGDYLYGAIQWVLMVSFAVLVVRWISLRRNRPN